MEMQTTELTQAIVSFSQQYVAAYREKLNHYPLVEADADWPSPCEIEPFDDKLSTWQPCAIETNLSFDNVEQALELTLHSSIKQYYTSIFSEAMSANCAEGYLQLLFAWSEDDFERLQQNIIGHVLMKQKLKQDVTVFFALTDQDDIVLTVDNDSGEIWAEKVGKKPHKKVANSMVEFILSLTPDVYVEN